MAASDTFSFGAGVLWCTQLTDFTGASVAVPTPFLLGTMQDCSVDFSWDSKPLYGQNMAPQAMGRGKLKIAGKAKFARLDGLLFNSVVTGQPITTGIAVPYYDTAGTAIPATPGPYTITPAVPSSGTWAAPLAVRDGSGNTYTQVASGPTTGQYSVAAGVYTFAAADQTKTVFIDFYYTATSTAAKKAVTANAPMGFAPTFKANFLNPRSGNSLVLFAAMATKFQYATKNDDWTINELDFEALADPITNKIFEWDTTA